MPDPTMPDQYTRAVTAVAHIRAHTPLQPVVAIILGSGLGAFAAQVESPTTMPYAEIPHFPPSTVEGHSGNLLLGHIAGLPVAVLQGRIHAYEGYTLAEVAFPTRVLGLLGCRTLVVTNAAGSLRPDFPPGTLVALSDHINLTGLNAAAGPNDSRFATLPGSALRFFDMSEAYSRRLRALAHEEARRLGLPLEEGVYLAVLGPSFETPAEIRAFRTLGADLVGMSTVHEVIVARHMGLQVLGISVVTNAAAGVTSQLLHHDEVMDVGRQVATRLSALLTAILPRL